MATHSTPLESNSVEGWDDPPGLGRHVIVGSLVGILLSLPIITFGALAVGQQWQSALALGAFTSLWGGMGFGSMVGGVVYATKLESH